ncbi:P-loop containing nucleoside triphosphate hydrolase protein [Mucor mucedo]|uniref:P-loop containing nucleoside triphosphate hydrolase protein n=1 Tax=Mucor mucedo TaxID=29922 RepID=UPI00221F7095|nr:P-loop containing nucleoside triphosphate hydrolase protein [Mucor mucedo]KAI7892264.1 P-loop containing nucleoside triphosphate hydrolase protein [Mucor mucedo]
MLHSSLAVEDQEKVFDSPPEGFRKCIISSNIAETSLTIDGIRFIVDSGKVKEMNHDPASKMSRLSEFWISKASAKQRTGRAGRTGPGECFRLYSENEFNHFHDFAIPEIQRAPLEPLLLQIKSMDLGNPRQFDYIEMPSMDFINASMDFLHNLGAIDSNENLLGLGSVLAELPVDSIVGKMLIMGVVFNIVDPVITIAAGMSVQSPFTRVTYNTNPEVLKSRSQFDSIHGDPFTLLNLWQGWLTAKADSKTSSRKWCRQNGVEEQRLYEIAKMKKQFEKVLNDFQPGLLQSLSALNEDDYDKEAQADPKSRYAAQEKLRRERYDQKSNKRRRVLEIIDYSKEDTFELDKETDKKDIRDLEFTLMNNVKALQSRSASLSNKEIELVKLVICSSLYPQLAIGDEHNAYRKSNEIVFNTPTKNFLSLHPSSVIASHPEWVQGLEEHIRKDDKTVEAALYHQLLCYLQLLETTKPFIVNITRVPGIHVLLLFGKVIDTNTDCSVLVVDSYFMIKFRTTQVAEYILYLTYKLRSTWDKLLNLRISRGLGKTFESHLENSIISPSTKMGLPYAIQQILDDQTDEINNNKPIDMWTSQAEEQYQAQMQSLNSNMYFYHTMNIGVDKFIRKIGGFYGNIYIS